MLENFWFNSPSPTQGTLWRTLGDNTIWAVCTHENAIDGACVDRWGVNANHDQNIEILFEAITCTHFDKNDGRATPKGTVTVYSQTDGRSGSHLRLSIFLHVLS